MPITETRRKYLKKLIFACGKLGDLDPKKDILIHTKMVGYIFGILDTGETAGIITPVEYEKFSENIKII